MQAITGEPIMAAMALRGTTRELKELFRLAAPIAFAQAGWATMGIVDTIVVGRAGATSLAAVGSANALYFTILSLGMGLMLGLDPLISQALGAGDAVRARRLYWLGNRLAIGTAAVLTVPLLITPLLLRPIGIADEVARETTSYLLWRLPSIFPFLLFIVARSYVQATRMTRPLVFAAVASNVVNLFADLLFVFGGASLPAWTLLQWVPAMGAAGAAVATVLCTFLQLAIVGYAIRKNAPANLPADVWRGSPADRGTALRVGLPIGLHMLAEVGVFALAALLATRMGAQSGAAHNIAISLASFTFTVVVGIGSAGSVRVGWAIGAGDTPRARRSGFTALLGGALFMGSCGLLFITFPRLFASLMTNDRSVLEAAAALMVVTAVFQLSDGLQGVGAGILRGAGDSHFTFIANVVGHYVVGLPIALALGLWGGMGVTGLWWGLCAGLTAVAIALVIRFARLSSKPIRALGASKLDAAVARVEALETGSAPGERPAVTQA